MLFEKQFWLWITLTSPSSSTAHASAVASSITTCLALSAAISGKLRARISPRICRIISCGMLPSWELWLSHRPVACAPSHHRQPSSIQASGGALPHCRHARLANSPLAVQSALWRATASKTNDSLPLRPGRGITPVTSDGDDEHPHRQRAHAHTGTRALSACERIRELSDRHQDHFLLGRLSHIMNQFLTRTNL